jgi:hypothetical protein
MVDGQLRWPDVTGMWTGFTVTAPAGEIGIVEAIVPESRVETAGMIVRGGVAGVRRFHVAASDVEAVNTDAREITLSVTPAGSESWAAMRTSVGIAPDEWRARALAAIDDPPRAGG